MSMVIYYYIATYQFHEPLFVYINITSVNHSIKVEYHANENPLKYSEKIAYVGQRLMYPIIKKRIIPYHARFL